MISEPHKIKAVRKVNFTSFRERLQALKAADLNCFKISNNLVTFDLTSQGTSAMSQEQFSGLFIGDEAYAGSRNFEHLQSSVQDILGHKYVCPTHNLNGCHKLISTTMVNEGDVVFSNSMAQRELVYERRAEIKQMSNESIPDFTGNLGPAQLQEELSRGVQVSYIYVELFADGYRPVSISNLMEIKKIAEKNDTKVIINASRIIGNACYIRENEPEYTGWQIDAIVKEMVNNSHVCVIDAGQDPRSNVGGLISTDDLELHEKFQNEVVVYEGLHTYGGMAGRTMEVLALGLREMVNEDQANWIAEQVQRFASRLEGIPFYTGSDGVYIKADEFLPNANSHQAHTLACALYLKSGIRVFLNDRFSDEKILPIQVPRLALTNKQLLQISEVVNELYLESRKVKGLVLVSEPEWHDEAEFEWEIPDVSEYVFDCEPHTIAMIEYVGITSLKERESEVKKADYNTFLLPSDKVKIDLLTDSGTSAMSIEQWQVYIGSRETPATSEASLEFVSTIQEITGYKYIIPTHQGRAAEHIMSQVLIETGYVPGNMYFTTTKLHQEMAGGTFTDVIVDEAHQPTSDFPWKGNIDLNKLKGLVEKFGARSLPYISFEASVNMAGGQPFSMDNAREVYEFCKAHGIPVMFDATRVAENAYMIKKKNPRYKNTPIGEIVKELFSYGDGCTVSSKKDFLVNICGFLAFRDNKEYYKRSLSMLRKYEGSVANGGMSAGDMAAHSQGAREMVQEEYIRARVEQTNYLGEKLLEAGVPIVQPPGTHAIFLDAKRFLPHIDQDQFPAQALAAALYVKTGVRSMERGNVSKGRNPETGENYRPALELVRLTIPRRVYTNNHMDEVANGIIELYQDRDSIKGLKFTYEPPKLRFFQGRFEEIP
ncbi:tryptophanase [bacterium]|nr:tryptophanase [bacterium]